MEPFKAPARGAKAKTMTNLTKNQKDSVPLGDSNIFPLEATHCYFTTRPEGPAPCFQARRTLMGDGPNGPGSVPSRGAAVGLSRFARRDCFQVWLNVVVMMISTEFAVGSQVHGSICMRLA